MIQSTLFIILVTMKFTTILAALFIFILVSCSQHKAKQAINVAEITFADYLKSLDTIPIPFTHACSGPNFMDLSAHFDSSGFKKYGDRNCARPLGILFNSKDNIVLVDLSIADFCAAPFLISFDKNGNKLDALNLYGNTFADTASSSMPYFKIRRDKSIIVIDTAVQWKRDTALEKIPGSESIKIDSTIYNLSKNGKFIRVTQKK